MSATPSTMLELGTSAPDFQLPGVVSGASISLASFKEKHALLVMFICQHCPFVKHIRSELAALGRDYAGKDIGMVGIGANDPAVSSEDSPEGLRSMVRQWGLLFPVLYDESQETAKRYLAACTPDFFLFNRDRKLVYRGQLDDSRPGNLKPVNGADLRAAMDAVLAGRAVSANQKPSIGCNIKWRRGNAPAYFLGR